MTLFGRESMADRESAFLLPAGRTDRIEPVFIEQVRQCAFKRKPDRDGHRKLGCARCGRPKSDRSHMGQPPSVNPLGSGDPRVYQAMKHQWQALLIDLLSATSLPRGLAHVLAEGEVTFPTRQRRDQGNFRFLLEKALGDALTEGKWLTDDHWGMYEFGNLTASYERGVSATRLALFPTLAP